MFELQIGHLLASYTGDSEELEFEGEVYEGFYEDIQFLEPLHLKIKLINLDDGIECIFEEIDAKIEYEGVEREIHLLNVSRTFKQHFDPLAPDDIKFINMKNHTIDLKDIIREELIISLYGM